MEHVTLTYNALVAASDNERIKEAVKKERNRLRDFIRKRVGSEEDAEDILQDVFSELVETYRMMKPVEQVAAWLFRVARNKIVDRYRKKKTMPMVIQGKMEQEEGETFFLSDLLADPSADADAEMINKALMRAIEDALSELPAEQRQVFIAHELEDKSFKEISEATGVSVNTLLSRKHYAIAFLRKRLQHIYNEL